jgi:catechol 2,3-dioxygenase-like lactoylglutathione lyase family enzyme
VSIWFPVRDLDTSSAFYAETFGFEEVYRDEEGRWARLARDGVEVALAEEDTSDAPDLVLTLEVDDVRAEAERLRAAGVHVGTVLELPSTIRLLDVFDPDGNRIQLTQDLS